MAPVTWYLDCVTSSVCLPNACDLRFRLCPHPHELHDIIGNGVTLDNSAPSWTSVKLSLYLVKQWTTSEEGDAARSIRRCSSQGSAYFFCKRPGGKYCRLGVL